MQISNIPSPFIGPSHGGIPEAFVKVGLTPQSPGLRQSEGFGVSILFLNRLLRDMRSYIFVADMSGAGCVGVGS